VSSVRDALFICILSSFAVKIKEYHKMRTNTAIVFCATFVGLLTSIFTFNLLINNNILPSHAAKLEVLDVEPAKASASTTKEAVPTLAAPTENSVSKLDSIVNKALSGSQGSYSIAIKNLKTGETYYKNEHASFQSASLYKLWVMAATYKQIKDGKLKETDVLSEEIPVLNDKFNIASESAERTDGTITLSVGSALKQMITISHNYAALLLTSKIKLTSLKSFLETGGFTQSSIGEPPKTTAADTMMYFEKLYKGQLADPEYTSKMLDLLKQQRFNHKLPKYLPSETIMAHKTGELNGVSHDAGIVYTNKGDYIIVVLSDSNYPKGAEERLAAISKAVYSYFISQ
jgi:beta-lactamase class A